MKRSVYFLRDAERPCFKIGIAKDVLRRGEALLEKIDFDQSFYVQCQDIGAVNARRLEATLHTVFSQYNARKEVGIGHTEWFSTECWDQVRSFLLDHQEDWEISKPLTIPARKRVRVYPSAKPIREKKPPIVAAIRISLTLEDYRKLRAGAYLHERNLADYCRVFSLKQAEKDIAAYKAKQNPAA